MAAVMEAVDVHDLASMFAGDDLAAGYPTATLVEEICRRTRPENVSEVRRLIYPFTPVAEVPKQARCAIAVGYTDWVTSGRAG